MINMLLISAISICMGFVLGYIWVEITWDEEAELLKLKEKDYM